MLHHQTQAWRWLIYECLLEGNHVRLIDRCENPDFIESIVFFLVGQTHNLYLLERIDAIIVQSFDFVDRGVGPITKFFDDLKVIDGRHYNLTDK